MEATIYKTVKLIRTLHAKVISGRTINTGGGSDWGSITGDIADQTDLLAALNAKASTTALTNGLALKVDKVTGKGLSENDYTTADQQKLAGISAGAEVNVQADWDQEINTEDDYIKNKPSIPDITELNRCKDLMTDGTKGMFIYDNYLYNKSASTNGQVGASFYTISNAARPVISVIDTGYGKKRALDLNTYNYAAGGAIVSELISIIPSYGVITMERRVKIPILSTSAERFSCVVGLMNGVAFTSTDYIYFSYSDNVNSGKFLLNSCVGSSATTLDSAFTPLADIWYTLKIVTNTAGTNATFYINGNSVGTISTNLPTSVDLHGVAFILKSSGTNSRSMYVDWSKIGQYYN